MKPEMPEKKLAVCSAATKSSVILCLENLIGTERFRSLDCFLAGDDVKEKKPDPSISLAASKAALVCYDLLHVAALERRGPMTNCGDALSIVASLRELHIPGMDEARDAVRRDKI
ncbi:unnamed protein product [Trifolium pratense]|uniref:Uncharacterized protein n=1 Tax=Trifolium pratense TaxID=57577 RepID=A0ACB0M8U7_TRIPR|nr:unnamed protein product [Trifolium pratense]